MVTTCGLETRVVCGVANAVVVSTTGLARRGVGGEEEDWREREIIDSVWSEDSVFCERGTDGEVDVRREKYAGRLARFRLFFPVTVSSFSRSLSSVT